MLHGLGQLIRTPAAGHEHGSAVRLSAPRWRDLYVIAIQPHMTSVKQILIDTSTAVRMRSYLLRSGSLYPPLLSNLYLTEVDRMLERAIVTTRYRKYTAVQYARLADDLLILIDAHPRHDWLVKAVNKRLREELAKLRVEINEEKSRIANLAKGDSFGFLGFEFRRILSRKGERRPNYTPKLKKRTALLGKLRDVF
ncbi:MAG: reverse transcriptase domain-containing protein [Bryobacteraceae bacterium]